MGLHGAQPDTESGGIPKGGATKRAGGEGKGRERKGGEQRRGETPLRGRAGRGGTETWAWSTSGHITLHCGSRSVLQGLEGGDRVLLTCSFIHSFTVFTEQPLGSRHCSGASYTAQAKQADRTRAAAARALARLPCPMHMAQRRSRRSSSPSGRVLSSSTADVPRTVQPRLRAVSQPVGTSAQSTLFLLHRQSSRRHATLSWHRRHLGSQVTVEGRTVEQMHFCSKRIVRLTNARLTRNRASGLEPRPSYPRPSVHGEVTAAESPAREPARRPAGAGSTAGRWMDEPTAAAVHRGPDVEVFSKSQRTVHKRGTRAGLRVTFAAGPALQGTGAAQGGNPRKQTPDCGTMSVRTLPSRGGCSQCPRTPCRVR